VKLCRDQLSLSEKIGDRYIGIGRQPLKFIDETRHVKVYSIDARDTRSRWSGDRPSSA
jgi:hypothetical protein